MAQSYCLFVKAARKMYNSINSESLFDIEFPVDGIIIVEERESND
jgi:hypothetical protein